MHEKTRLHVSSAIQGLAYSLSVIEEALLGLVAVTQIIGTW